MFVIVKRERFATVSVGILKMLLNVLLLGFRRTGYGCVCLYEGIIFWIILNMFWTCVFFIVNVLFLDIFIVGFVLPLLKLAKMYRWLTLPATSRGPLWVLNWGVAACVTPSEAYAPCPLALHYDGDQNCEREVIANGRRGQGSCLSQNGFSTAVHRSLHEHVTNNHSDIEWRYEVIL